MWGTHPWDNDSAADWFGNLMDKTGLPDLVRHTLLMAKEEDTYGENTAILRAASYCVLQFGRIYVWPIDALDHDLALAVAALQKVLSDKGYCYSDEIVGQIQMEMRELQNRIDDSQ